MNFTIQKYNNFGDFSRKSSNESNRDDKLFYNHSRNNSMRNVGQQLSPRSELSFSRKENISIKGDQSVRPYLENRAKGQKDNKDNSSIYNYSNVSSISHYLDRRHVQTQEKLNKLRSEKYKSETSELKFKPTISKQSRKIIDDIVRREAGEQPLSKVQKYNNYIKPSAMPIRTDKISPHKEKRDGTREPEQYRQIIEQRERQAKFNMENQTKVENIQNTKPIVKERRMEAPVRIYNRPNSSNPRQSQIIPLDPHSEQQRVPNKQNNFDNDKTMYNQYDVGRVIDSRHKLHNYYGDKKLSDQIEQKVYTHQPNLYPVNNTFIKNTKNDNPRIDNEHRDYTTPFLGPSNPIHSETIVTTKPEQSQINFYQLDQFSPPYNPSGQIAYNMPERHQNPTSSGNPSDIENNRRKNLDSLKHYADNVGNNRNVQDKYTSKTTNNVKKDFEFKDPYKLDNQARSQLQDKINQYKIDPSYAYSNYSAFRPTYY